MTSLKNLSANCTHITYAVYLAMNSLEKGLLERDKKDSRCVETNVSHDGSDHVFFHIERTARIVSMSSSDNNRT